MRKGKKKGGRKEKREKTNRRESERKGKKKRLPLLSKTMEIGPSVFVGARGKVDPRNKGYAWVPKSGSFVKL